MIRYELRNLDDDTAQQLIGLSQLWAEENCSYGIVPNEIEDLSEPLAVALEEDRIVGYIFGHYYKQERNTSYAQLGSDCFSLDELYVLPEYRSKGIGRKLFRLLEEHIAEKCAYLTLTTSTKDYKRILNLYVEELGMEFHNAFLIKSMEERV